MTNASGVFELYELPETADTLIAEFIGYGRATVPLRITRRPTRGIVARLALHRSTMSRPCEAFGLYGVRVEVRDALTGHAPVGPVSLFVRQDSVAGWDLARSDGIDEFASLLASLQPATLGRFRYPESLITAEVAVPGYATWRRTGFDLPREGCGSVLTDPIPVWLLPVARSRR